MDRLTELRGEIDALDEGLAELFQARMAAAEKIAACKRELGLPILDPARERAVLDRGEARIADPALRPYYRALLQKQMDLSRARQAELFAPEGEGLLWIRAPGGSYPVYLERGCLNRAGTLLDLDRRVFLVADSGVPARFVQTLSAQCRQVTVHAVPRGEVAKTPSVLTELLGSMQSAGLTRADCVLALGGGAAGDLAGLAAGLYMRGVDFFCCPTTFLSMADASVGGKTAVNLCGVKNAVGLFRQPKAVLIDPDALETLPQRQLANGLAEAVKMGLTHDPALFARFEDPAGLGPMEEIIAACLRVKRAVVEADEREQGLRRVLNFGHTLGHGLEAAAGGALLHGECVALGMLPMCAPEVRARLAPVLKRLGLPTEVDFDSELALRAILHDKKAEDGGVRIVTVPAVGSFAFRIAGPEELRRLLLTLKKE